MIYKTPSYERDADVIYELLQNSDKVYYDDHRLLSPSDPVNIDAVKWINENSALSVYEGQRVIYTREGDNGYWSWK